jgi:serine/threonine protein kinase, bacterial
MAFIRIASAMMTTAALGISGIVAGCATATSPQNSSASPSSKGVASAPASSGPQLDGTFRIDTKYSQGVVDGAPVPGGTDSSRWYAFRSACTPVGCTAAATQLENDDHDEVKQNGATATLKFTDGRWQTITPIPGTMACAADAELKLKVATSWSFAPQSDGTLTGTKAYTELKNGIAACTGSGKTAKYPITLVREGPVPASIVVANPPPP